LIHYLREALAVDFQRSSGFRIDQVPGEAYAYLFRDVLGSVDVIANQIAQVIQRQSFDAWGNRRDASASGGWGILPAAYAAGFDTSTTFQGYTGHQQLDPAGLIHMKGRLYGICGEVRQDRRYGRCVKSRLALSRSARHLIRPRHATSSVDRTIPSET
jgi:hypothetical protein